MSDEVAVVKSGLAHLAQCGDGTNVGELAQIMDSERIVRWPNDYQIQLNGEDNVKSSCFLADQFIPLLGSP
ncbi:uncharacterized protein RAG0_01446 [Rhynchosporium agropyri]|uniref:Uncharacterized protein n=1 Tax=Rhynchosporium agropyri TaxID=914238 RepID=A0A1E1K1C3_9HELO|nr:uncharacterized protein RAG0_01446 [Rhynchosporium agropyri]